MDEAASDLSPRLVECVLAYVVREGGRTALAAVRERVALPSPAPDDETRVDRATFTALLRAVQDVLAQPEAPERIGRQLHVLLERDVLSTLIRGARRVAAAYRELPHLFEAIDPTCAVEVEQIGMRRVRVRFYAENGGVSDELKALHRGVVAALPAFFGLPHAELSPLPRPSGADTGGEDHGVEARWRRPRLRLEPALGLVSGGLLGGALLVYTGLYENAELITLPLRIIGLAAFAVLGLVFGLRARLALDLEREAALVDEQNTELRGQVASLRRSREDLRRARRRLEDEVRERTAELELKRERMSKLLDLGHDLSATLDIETILDIAMVRVPQMLSARVCSIYLLESDSGQLKLVAHNQQRRPPLDDTPREPSDAIEGESDATVISTTGDPDPAAPGWLMRRVIDEERALLVHDIEAELGRPSHPRYRTSSCMVLLLRSGGALIGVLNVADSIADGGGGVFDESRFQLAKIIGEHLGTAISNARLLRQTQLLSITDGLTGLYLHRHFQETLEREVERARRYERPLALLLLDVDSFKSLNDRFGHPTGDDVLRSVAHVLRKQLRTSDMAARYGGDEFAAILPQTTAAGGRALAERIRSEVHALDRTQAGMPRVTVSIGVCEFVSEMDRADLIENADRALYDAKDAGRDRVAVWSSSFSRVRPRADAG